MEDDRPQAGLLADALKLYGHSVEVTYSGTDAWKALESEPFDLLLTDLHVGGSVEVALGEGGIALIANVRNPSERATNYDSLRKLKIIAMTGGGQLTKGYDVLDLADSFGADLCLRKPVSLQDLSSAIKSLLLRSQI